MARLRKSQRIHLNPTSSTRKSGATAKKHCEHNATFHGLHAWYVEMFEKLGWMVLAKKHGHMEDKISSYKNSLRRLKEKIECKLASTHDSDLKQDLKIMWDNIMILIEHANRDL